MSTLKPKVGLVLASGGSARCRAYQVGVLKGLAELLPQDAPIPFQTISGTFRRRHQRRAHRLPCTQNFRLGIAYLDNVWREISSEKVFKTGAFTALGTSLHWVFTLMSGGMDRHNPISLLDNAPLRELLKEHIPLERLEEVIDSWIAWMHHSPSPHPAIPRRAPSPSTRDATDSSPGTAPGASVSRWISTWITSWPPWRYR